jgi:hypothetical protein
MRGAGARREAVAQALHQADHAAGRHELKRISTTPYTVGG